MKAKCNDVGEAYAQSTVRMPNTYTAQHVTKELKFHPNKYVSLLFPGSYVPHPDSAYFTFHPHVSDYSAPSRGATSRDGLS